MTDFHKLFMVKIDKLTKKKTGESSWSFILFMVALCMQIARKLCLVYSPNCRLHTFCATFKR